MVALTHSDTRAGDTAESSLRLRARVETGLIIAGLLAMFVLLEHGIWGDGRVRYDMLTALLQRGQLTTAKYSLMGPLFSAPLWYLGKFVESSEWWLARYNVLVFAAGLLVLYRLLKDRVDRGLLRRFFLLLMVASMFPFHVQTYYGEVFTAICVGVGLVAVVVGPSLSGWIAITLGVVNTPASALALGCVVLKRILDTQRLRYLLVVVACAVLIVGESWIRRGAPTASNYEPGFTYPLFFGAISLLFSFGAGILFFAPGLFLPIRSRLSRLREQGMTADLYAVYVLWMIFTACLVLVYARWYDWPGGWYWGPRFLLFASIPASFALAVRLHGRDASLFANILTALVLLLSCWVGINGAIFGLTTLNAGFHGYACQPLLTWQAGICYESPQLSVLWQPFIVASELHWNVRAFIAAEQLGTRNFLFGAFSLVVYAYLALPLLRTIAQQTRTLLASYARAHLRRFAF
ncbi:MAG: hypothetical protein ACHQ4H_17010 [Ktedonobacterales bacterium]